MSQNEQKICRLSHVLFALQWKSNFPRKLWQFPNGKCQLICELKSIFQPYHRRVFFYFLLFSVLAKTLCIMAWELNLSSSLWANRKSFASHFEVLGKQKNNCSWFCFSINSWFAKNLMRFCHVIFKCAFKSMPQHFLAICILHFVAEEFTLTILLLQNFTFIWFKDLLCIQDYFAFSFFGCY